ncbi:MAG: hypothetical protein KVP17_002033 [Porospora cf. gigantea B]|nr:MAG: hypothetical protein KVP17_002033 [Porospora cf. gigantea B]
MQSALEANPQIITGFNAKVKQLIREKRSLLVVGIDPRRDQLQRDYPDDPLGVALRSFCMKLVDDT